MSARPPVQRPTRAELELLRILWRTGPASARGVHEAASHERRDGSYATVLRFLQIMRGKGLVTRGESRRPHVYAPIHALDSLQSKLLEDFIQKAFGGSGKALVMAALRGHPDSKERGEIEALLRQEDGK